MSDIKQKYLEEMTPIMAHDVRNFNCFNSKAISILRKMEGTEVQGDRSMAFLS